MDTIDSKLLPNHIAVIPDGNRRWAKRKGLAPWKGHEKGAEVIEEIVRTALKMGIKNISFWGSSLNNLQKRPLTEKRALLQIYEEYFEKLINSREIYENSARINIVGRWAEQFPKKLTGILKEGMEKTKKHSRHFLNFLLAYNGDDDMLYAVNQIIKQAKNGKLSKINSETIKNNLLSAPLPAVDLIVRTGTQKDPHNSAGFLMWQTQNSQFYFSEKFLPDFKSNDFKKAIRDFCQRQRRVGK